MEELEKKKQELLLMVAEFSELGKIWKNQITAEQTMRKCELDMDIKAIKKEITILSKQSTVSSVPKEIMDAATKKRELLMNPLNWLRNYADINNVDLSRKGILSNGRELKHIEHHSEIILSIDAEMKAYNDVASQYKLPKVAPFTPTLLQAAEISWYREITKAKRDELNRLIKFDPNSSDKVLRDWLKLMTGEVRELHVAIFKHWIQCTKRKMLGLSVEYHLFPILVGPQGAGKSQCISKLVEPLDGYVLELEVTQVLDKTIAGAFETNAVVVLDELSQADKASMEEVKRMITLKYLDARPPYGRQLEKMDQNCMLIASSNRNVVDVFKDEEMRRFAEIKAVKRDRETYPVLDAMDMLDVWRSVDELAQNEYYFTQVKEIEAHQRTLTTKPYLNQWADDVQLSPGTSLRLSETLYNSYNLWLDQNGARYGASSKQGFGKMLSMRLGIESIKKPDGTIWHLVDDTITVIEPGDAAYVLSKSNHII